MTCEERKERKRQENREEYAWLKARGFCTSCRKERAEPNRVQCSSCMEKNAARARTRYVAKKDEIAVKAKARYDAHKEQGLCLDCGQPASHGSFCYTHYIHRKTRDRKKCEQKHRVIDCRAWNDLCLQCGEPLDTDKKLCSACCAQRAVNTHLWWERLKEEDPERYAALVQSQRLFFGKYAREGASV